MPIDSTGEIPTADNLNLRLLSIERKFQEALPKNLYTPFESLRLRFISTPDCQGTNIAGYISVVTP